MYRLLIADDEESIREGVADFVRQNCPEWDVAALARDGREALALAREILPDAVLTDITMPHMNGLEFLESLSDLLPEAKLLVLSGYDQFEYAVQALRLGVSDYLLKPLDTAKLVSALSRFAAELDAQALRWAQIETLRTNTQKTNELELQSYFRAALLGEELPALSAANAVFAQEGTSYCCVLCDGLDAQRALLERVLEQRLYGAVRTVLLRLGTPPRQAVVFCAPRTARAGLFLTLSHALTSIAVSCKRAQALDVHFFGGCIAETPAKLELSYRQSTQARAYAFPEQAAPVTTYEDVLAGKLLPCPEPPEELLRDIQPGCFCPKLRSAVRMVCGAGDPRCDIHSHVRAALMLFHSEKTSFRYADELLRIHKFSAGDHGGGEHGGAESLLRELRIALLAAPPGRKTAPAHTDGAGERGGAGAYLRH